MDHPANTPLFDPAGIINTRPGRDLHALCWIDDDRLIGEIGVEWNWLAGHSDPDVDPNIVHYTDGLPSLAAYRGAPYSQEFFAALSAAAWGGS